MLKCINLEDYQSGKDLLMIERRFSIHEIECRDLFIRFCWELIWLVLQTKFRWWN